MPRQKVLPAACALPSPSEAGPSLPEDSTEAYLCVWQAYESVLSRELVAASASPLAPAERGRATTTNTHVKYRQPFTVSAGRSGELKPGFFGSDRVYVLWFRQLRRLQSLCQALAKATDTDTAVEYRANLWHAIRTAPGFRPSFAGYWPHRGVKSSMDPPAIPAGISSEAVARIVFQTFQANVRAMEKDLKRGRQRLAKSRRLEDPRLIFRDLKKARAMPVDTIVEGAVAKVLEVDEDVGAVLVDGPHDWKPSAGFYLNQRPVAVHHAEPDMLWGDLLDALPGDTVSQKIPVADLPSLFRAFGANWSKYWMRHANVDVARWRQISRMDAEPPARPYCAMELTVSLWRATARAKHAFTATGPDGVSRYDLLALPDALTATGAWPVQMLDAVVTAVEKTEEATLVGHYRPICVLSLPYRVWASIRAREALAHVASFAPARLHGNLPGRSAGAVWWRLQLSAALDGTALSGAFLDLSKAFNTLPRAPVFALALHFGVPEGVVKAWSAAVSKLSRRFRIRQATGPALPSFTGFAEGDPLSCLAMALVDLALHRHVGSTDHGADLESFVDDWQLTGPSPDSVLRAVASVEEFTRGWELTLDPSKMVVWSTSAADRRVLRRGGHSVVNSVRSLGGHQAFTRVRSNGTLQARIQAAEPLWLRLRSSIAPLYQKVRALSVAAWPLALHGASCTNVSDTDVGCLRSGAIRGLGLDRPGLNPEVVLSLVEYPLADPGFFILDFTFRDMRAFGSRETVVPMIEDVLATPTRWGPGPVQVFLERCFSVGIAWSASQQCLEDAISVFDLWEVSPQELRFRLVLAWQSRVAHSVASRPGFEGLDLVDAQRTRKLKEAWSPVDKLHALNAHAGTFFTHNPLRYFGSGVPESAGCKFCGAPDGVRHRLWHCDHFASCRSVVGPELPAPGLIPNAQALRGWVLRPARQMDLWRLLACLPDQTLMFAPPVVVESPMHLFTDGSCLLPDCPQLRLAAWAVVYVPTSGLPNKVIASGPVWGLIQTAFRGEITAVISALAFAVRTGVPACIWSDCAGAVRVVNRILAGTFRWRPALLNADLWQRVQSLVPDVPPGTCVCKVVAHVRLDQTRDVAEEWAALGNADADRAAGAASVVRDAGFWAVWEDVRRDYVLQGIRGEAVLNLHRAIATAATLDRPCPATPPDPLIQRPGGPCIVPEWPGDVPRHLTRYGVDFVKCLHAWLLEMTSQGGQPVWTSFLQLYMAFVFDTSVCPPVYESRRKRWIQCGPGDVQLLATSLGQRCRFFRQQVKAVIHHVRGQIAVQETRPHSAALAIKLPCAYVPFRADISERVETWLLEQLPNGTCVQNGREWATLPFPCG